MTSNYDDVCHQSLDNLEGTLKIRETPIEVDMYDEFILPTTSRNEDTAEESVCFEANKVHNIDNMREMTNQYDYIEDLLDRINGYVSENENKVKLNILYYIC